MRDVITQMTSLTPLTGPNGQAYLFSLGTIDDLILDKMTQAVTIRIPGKGDVSQIPYLADDRSLEQGPAETNASFIQRLQSAFPDAKIWGSRYSILRELQAYMQNLQPGVSAPLPQMLIVGGNDASGVVPAGDSAPPGLTIPSQSTWDEMFFSTAIGAPPVHTTVSPANFNWDGHSKPWRSWLVLFMSLVPTGLSGSGAALVSASAGSLPGGHNVNGVWVPLTSGTPVNSPWITISGMSGLTSNNVGQWVTFADFGQSPNNGVFPIVEVISATECVIANPNAAFPDSGGFWSIGSYPWIGPALPWGSPTAPAFSATSTVSFALNCSSALIQSIRQIVKKRKAAHAYYPHIIVAFDGGTGATGSAYSPSSAQGAGNPDGSFGASGKNVAGVWVPTRLISSTFDAYCDGTGQYANCSVQNVT